MAREKIDNKLNLVIGTKAQIEGDTSIPENSIIVVTDEELKADEVVYSVEKNVKEAMDDLEVNKVDKADIVDNLTTDDATKVLSAKQGKVLNDAVALKVNTSDIVDNLTATDTNKPLSAKQGKELQDTKEALTNKATNFSVVNDIKYPTTKAVKDLIDTTVGDIEDILDSILGV